MKPALFLDRDGALIEEREYLCDPEQVVLFPEAIPALTRFRDAGWALVLVTNQSGVGRGYFTLEQVHRVHERLQQLLSAGGIHWDAIHIAPEAPDQPSLGRKPSPYFLQLSAHELNLDLAHSIMAGDKASDVLCGRNAGVRESYLLLTGYGNRSLAQWPSEQPLPPTAQNLLDLANQVLGS